MISRDDSVLIDKAERACGVLCEKTRSMFLPKFAWLPPAKKRACKAFFAFKHIADEISAIPAGTIPLHDRQPSTPPGPVGDPFGGDDFADGMGDFGPGMGDAGDFGGGEYDDGSYKRPETDAPEEQRRFAAVDRWGAALTMLLGDPYAPPDENIPLPPLAEVINEYSDLKGVEILPAIREIVLKNNVPKPVFFEVLYGTEIDLVPGRFKTFDLSADYCHAINTSNIVASLAIWGTNEPLFSNPVVKAAKAAGVAFRWTEVLARLIEDTHHGRLYLPLEELQRVNLTERQLLELLEISGKRRRSGGGKGDNYALAESSRTLIEFQGRYERLIATQLNRCETYFYVASELYEMISPDSRAVYGNLWAKYYRVFRKMARKPDLIFSGNADLSGLEKLRMDLGWKLFPAGHMNRRGQ